jgi:hypothetical protein
MRNILNRECKRLLSAGVVTTIKLNPISIADRDFFCDLTEKNIKYSALRFKIPNIANEIDIGDPQQVQEYFSKAENRQYLNDAYDYVSKFNNECEFGYSKVYLNGDLVGLSGFMPQSFNERGLVNLVQRGHHYDASARCSDVPSSSPVIRPRVPIAAIAMKQKVKELYANRYSLDMEGTMLSQILTDNTRSQNFALQTGLNVGEPTRTEDGNDIWERKIGNFLNNKNDIVEKLDQKIRKAQSR